MVELNRHIVGAIAILALAGGCSHRLKVYNLENLPSYACDSSQRGLRLKLIDGSRTGDSDYLASEVARALSAQADCYVQYGLRNAAEPAEPDAAMPDAAKPAEPVAVVRILVDSDYSGSGSNFFVSWPGYLVFAPALLGYKYHARYEIKVDMAPAAGKPLTRLKTIPLHLEVRHSRYGRTAGAEMGWIPIYFWLPVINGFCCMSYDADVTTEIRTAAFPRIADYVAAEIVKGLAGCMREADIAQSPASAPRRSETPAQASTGKPPAATRRMNAQALTSERLDQLKRRYERGLCTEEDLNRERERLTNNQ